MRTLAIAVAVITIALFVAASQYEPPQQQQCVVSIDEREHVREIVIKGIDKGYQDYIANLFTVWVREKAEYNPVRASAGMDKGLSAYNRAYRWIIGWDPPICGKP